MKSFGIQLAGEEVYLHPERAMSWPRMKILLISDPHFGKAATFRLSGIPVPENTHHHDLERLSIVLHHTQAEHLLILGDFYHARKGCVESTLESLSQWRAQWPDLRITLIEGNHDRLAGKPDPSLRIETNALPLAIAPFLLCHEPRQADQENPVVLAGHLHPGYRIASRTASCFHWTGSQMIFPAYGSFTGKSLVQPSEGDQVFLIGDEEVIALPPFQTSSLKTKRGLRSQRPKR